MGAAGDVLKEIDMDGKENFSQTQIHKFNSDPEHYRRFVKAIEKEVNGAFPIVSSRPAETLFPAPKITNARATDTQGRPHADLR